MISSLEFGIGLDFCTPFKASPIRFLTSKWKCFHSICTFYDIFPKPNCISRQSWVNIFVKENRNLFI